jgi:hypothetical protein
MNHSVKQTNDRRQSRAQPDPSPTSTCIISMNSGVRPAPTPASRLGHMVITLLSLYQAHTNTPIPDDAEAQRSR